MRILKRNTKEDILLAALQLFADKGYDGVSVRDIAEVVGIRQSSLYKHYESKQDIFDNILIRMEEQYQQMTQEVRAPQGDMTDVATAYEQITTEELKAIARGMFFYWTESDYASRFRKMLMIEQYKSEEKSRLYHEYLTDGPLKYMTELFHLLIERKCFIDEDAAFLALEFYSPIVFLMARYDSGAERTIIIRQLDQHIEHFAGHYRKD